MNELTIEIPIAQDEGDEPTRRVEICFFCRGDASTACCPERIEWTKLHGAKAPFGVHSPTEHV